MKNIFTSLTLTCLICFLETAISYSQSPALSILWNKMYGGNTWDWGSAIAKTPDGGYVIAGYTQSGDIEKYPPSNDMWLIKLDSGGELIWQKAFGGNSTDGFVGPDINSLFGADVAVASDGTIYLIGTTSSIDGEAAGNHGLYDMLVVKIDANGNILKSHCFGGTDYDYGFSITINNSGNILVAGTTSSNNFDATGNSGLNWWIMNIDDTLGIKWDKFFGSPSNAYEWPHDIQPSDDGGYFVTGDISGSGNDVTSFHGGSDVWTIKIDANGNLLWQRSLGGSETDDGRTILPTPDGGCLVGASTQSCDFDVTDHHGGCGNTFYDLWLIKFDAQGNVFWKKCFGGTYNENAGGLLLTPDYNYISLGYGNSNDGDVSGNLGSSDYWVLKVDPLGNKIYQQCIGTSGNNGDWASSCVLANDGSYIFAGSEEHDTPYTVLDYGIVKATEPPPAPLAIAPWTATLGGSDIDDAYDGEPTSDGGAIICGTTRTDSNGDVGCVNGGFPTQWVAKVDAHGIFQHGQCLIGGTAYSIHPTSDGGAIYTGYGYTSHGSWSVIKLDAIYNVEWYNGYGGNGYSPYSIQQINDGGYILAGVKHWATQPDTIITDHGSTEFCVMKIDATGTFLWEKFYGGSLGETAYSIDQTSDNGFVVAGVTSSSNGNVTGNHGGKDAWVIKIDANGNLQWQKTIGGTKTDQANWVRQTSDGGYIVACETNSTNGDAIGNHGTYDFLIVKLDASGNITWKKLLGGSGSDKAHSICQTSDGEYIAVGETYSTNGNVTGNHGQSDYWVVNLDANGNLLWQHCFGGSGIDIARSVSATSDGRVIVSGQAGSNDGDVIGNHGSDDYWVLKFIDGDQNFYQDADGDTYGNPAVSYTGFFPPAGYVFNNLDCNDSYAAIHPGNVLDICNGLDDDCDGVIDENGTYVRYFKDADGDSYGNSDSIQWYCSSHSGYETTGGDCNDANTTVHPGACEIYINGVDEDCSGIADDCNSPSSGFATLQITATTAKIKWNTLPCAIGYVAQYRKVGTITWTVININTNTGSKKLTGLQPQTNYEWQVKTKCHSAPNVNSPFSATQIFSTTPLRESDYSTGAALKLIPNPAKQAVTVSCSGFSDIREINLYNVLGQKIISRRFAQADDSFNQVINLFGLPSGLYVIELKSESASVTAKLIKE